MGGDNPLRVMGGHIWEVISLDKHFLNQDTLILVVQARVYRARLFSLFLKRGKGVSLTYAETRINHTILSCPLSIPIPSTHLVTLETL